MFQVKNVLCEYKESPTPIDNKSPRFCWQIDTNERGVCQSAYRIQVATDSDFESGKVWDTGKVESDQSLHIRYDGTPLMPCARYYFRVRVWAEGMESMWSAPQYFETGLLGSANWQADWITHRYKEKKKETKPVYYFFKDFYTDKPVKKATIFASALGLYNIYINDLKVGNSYFRPGFTSYDHIIQYQSYDVTDMLRLGETQIQVMLADGWYRGVFTFLNKRNLWGKQTALIFQMHVEYADGTCVIVVSDESWQVSCKGNVTYSEFYLGERYDARIDMKLLGRTNAKIYKHTKDTLVGQNGEDVVKIGEMRPVRIIQTTKGETVVDFGQNHAGWVRLNIKDAVSGQEIVLSHAEVLDENGNFYTRNLRKAKAQLVYIASGEKEEIYEPHFTYMGYRYVKIEGYESVDLNTVTSCVICSELKPTGKFICSNEYINRLESNIVWSQKANFIEIPTDCPQRDERMGYTGDAQIFVNAASFNMRTAKFLIKWLNDLKLDQAKSGLVDMTIPRDIKILGIRVSSSGFGDAATIVPWNIYQYFGDKKVLEDQYESMKKWVDFLTKKAAILTREERRMDEDSKAIARYICNKGLYHLGDWLAPGEEKKEWVAKKYWVGTAYFAHSAHIVSKTARVLGNHEDEQKYRALFENICNAFVKKFVLQDGRIRGGFQSAYALALHFNIIPEHLKAQAAEYLAEDVRAHDNHLTTGFLGTPSLCFALSDNGQQECAMDLLLQDTCPSWLYPVKMGATSVWERWDSLRPDGTINETMQGHDNMVSFNHYAYGAIGDWLYRRLGGIQTDEYACGFKRIVYAPIIPYQLSFVHVSYESMYGKIEAKWEKKNGKIFIDLELPANTTACVKLPLAKLETAYCNGASLIQSSYISNIEEAADGVLFSLKSGKYNFEYAQSNNNGGEMYGNE